MARAMPQERGFLLGQEMFQLLSPPLPCQEMKPPPPPWVDQELEGTVWVSEGVVG